MPPATPSTCGSPAAAPRRRSSWCSTCRGWARPCRSPCPPTRRAPPAARRRAPAPADVRAVVQRAREASVTVDGEVVGAIGAGLVALVGVTHDDDHDHAVKLAGKIANLRVVDDDAGVMNRSVLDAGGEVLVVSQFTLYGDTSRGRR